MLDITLSDLLIGWFVICLGFAVGWWVKPRIQSPQDTSNRYEPVVYPHGVGAYGDLYSAETFTAVNREPDWKYIRPATREEASASGAAGDTDLAGVFAVVRSGSEARIHTPGTPGWLGLLVPDYDTHVAYFTVRDVPNSAALTAETQEEVAA